MFVGSDEDRLRCVACGGEGLWRDCDIHTEVECYAVECEDCGVVSRDCGDPDKAMVAAGFVYAPCANPECDQKFASGDLCAECELAK